MKKAEGRSNWDVEQLALKAIEEHVFGFRHVHNVFETAEGCERALTALFVRLGYSPHNAFAHGKLVPLADDPGSYPVPCYPHQTPVLDK